MKKSKKIILISFIVILLIIVLISLFSLIEKDNNFLETIQKKFSNQETSNEKNSENTNPSTTAGTSTSSGRSSGGSSGGGSSSGSSSSNPECVLKQINYALINPDKNLICNLEQEEICLNKTIECTITIENRDSSTTGIFGIQILFVEDGKSREEYFDSHFTEFSLGPSQENTITAVSNIQSSGKEGLANQEINCFYNTLEVPQKCA